MWTSRTITEEGHTVATNTFGTEPCAPVASDRGLELHLLTMSMLGGY